MEAVSDFLETDKAIYGPQASFPILRSIVKFLLRGRVECILSKFSLVDKGQNQLFNKVSQWLCVQCSPENLN